jgi:dTDP-glucose 4,6-dehydratase
METLIHPQMKNIGATNPVGPRGVYDEAKRFQEASYYGLSYFHHVETR